MSSEYLLHEYFSEINMPLDESGDIEGNLKQLITSHRCLLNMVNSKICAPSYHKCPKCGSDKMQQHCVHEVAELCFCPNCLHVRLYDPDGVTEYNPITKLKEPNVAS